MEHNTGAVGQKVLFGRMHGEKTLGEIVKINPTKFKVKQLEARGSFRDYPIGTVWSVPASLCSIVDANAGISPVIAPVRRKRRAMLQPLISMEDLAMARAERR